LPALPGREAKKKALSLLSVESRHHRSREALGRSDPVAVQRPAPAAFAAARTLRESSISFEYASHFSRWRSLASGVPLKALKVRPQARQR
jgi:hypothetical protein